jgi:hypothetical protein
MGSTSPLILCVLIAVCVVLVLAWEWRESRYMPPTELGAPDLSQTADHEADQW